MDGDSARFESAGELRRVIRPSAGAVWLSITAVIAVGLLVDVVIRGGWIEGLLVAPWPLLLVWFLYVFLYAPHVVADEHGVAVHNILRITRIPWAAIDDIVMRWQLEFRLRPELARRPVQAWGAPRKRPPRRSGDAPADVEADILLEMKANAETPGGPTRITHAWDVPALIALAVLVVWGGIALLATR